MKKILLKQLVIIPLFAFFILSLTLVFTVQAQGGFGVSGSFQNYEYKVVPGESVDASGVNVVLFNHYDVDIDVSIELNGPEGVDFLTDISEVSIDANDNVELPIGLSVDETATPGDYDIGFSASVIQDEVEGISVTGAAELSTSLIVMGEAADLQIAIQDYAEDPIESTLKLYRVVDGSLDPVAEAIDDGLTERLVPGDYRLIAYLDNYEIAKRNITLEDGDDVNETLTAQTIFLRSLSVTPRFSSESDEFRNVRLDYEIVNIHEPIENTSLRLNVALDGTPVDDEIQVTLPYLPEGSYQNSMMYVPPEGWESGEYTFTLQAESDEIDGTAEAVSLAESRIVDMSGIEAVNKLTERYLKQGKKLHLRHLSRDCRQLLSNADEIIEVNILEDPTYKVAIDR